MISNNEVKRTFKIVLNSFNTNSYIGEQFNANYMIDLRTIINDESAFDKSYKVTCNFVTKSENIANNQITSTNLYTLALNFNIGGLQVYNYDLTKNTGFILPVENITDTGGTVHTLLKLQDKDQQPLFLQNIRNMTNIYLNVYQSSVISAGNYSTNLFNPTSPDNSKYICILTFEEC